MRGVQVVLQEVVVIVSDVFRVGTVDEMSNSVTSKSCENRAKIVPEM